MLKFIEEEKKDIIMLLQILIENQEYTFCFQPLENDEFNFCFDQKDQAVNITQNSKTYTGYVQVGYLDSTQNISNFYTYQQLCQNFYNNILKNNLNISRIKVYIIDLTNDIEEEFNYDWNNYTLNIPLDNYSNCLIFDSNNRTISPCSFYSNISKDRAFTGFIFYLDASLKNVAIEVSRRKERWIL